MAKNRDPNFVAKAKIYDPHVYKLFTKDQKREVMNMKVYDRLIDVNTPSPGFHTDQNGGKLIPSTNLDSAIQAHIHEVRYTSGTNGTHMIPIPPDPDGNQSPVPSILNTNSSIAGQSFGGARSCTRPKSNDAIVASASINEKAY